MQRSGLSPRAVGLASAVVTVIIWTSFIVISRASSDPARGGTLTPFDIAMARMLGAGLLLLPWGWWLNARGRAQGTPPTSSLLGLSPLPLRTTLVAGFFGGLIYPLLAYNGFVYAPAAHASVLMPGSLPLWTTVLAAVMLGDRITPTRMLGLVFIVGGDLLVGGASLMRAFEGGSVWKGDLLFMCASSCWACYSVTARRHALEAVRATIAITVFACCSFMPVYGGLLALGWVEGHFFEAPIRDILFQMLFQGVGSVAIAGITFTKMIQYYGAVKSTMITALVPGLSALGAVFFLNEPLRWNLATGLAMVTVGIMFGVGAVSSATKRQVS